MTLLTRLTGDAVGASRALRQASVGVAVLAFVAAALGIGVRATPLEQVAVDEPQYLMTALSIAADGDLDIGDQLAQRDWQRFTAVEPPLETMARPDGSHISPHDPLLPLLLAVPTLIAGWVGAKLLLALVAAALAALTLWVAVRRFAVPLPLAVAGVAAASASAPLAVYGQQIYPELPAALACLTAVAALTGRVRRLELVVLGLAVVALAWLAMKYIPVAGALAALGLVRWSRGGEPGAARDAAWFGLALAASGGLYLLAHLVVWGGWTPYASGDHFQDIGQLGVMGTNPNFRFRSWRLIDLLVDRTFGLVVWQPAWLLLVPAVAALAAWRRHGQLLVLGLPLLAAWLVATYTALTMHGHWWPGRQVVVVLPLALLLILCWLARAGAWPRRVAAVLAAAGVFSYACVLVDGLSGELAWVNHFFTPDTPVFALLHPLLASYGTTTSNYVWLALLTLLAGTTYAVYRARSEVIDRGR